MDLHYIILGKTLVYSINLKFVILVMYGTNILQSITNPLLWVRLEVRCVIKYDNIISHIPQQTSKAGLMWLAACIYPALTPTNTEDKRLNVSVIGFL